MKKARAEEKREKRKIFGNVNIFLLTKKRNPCTIKLTERSYSDE